MSKLAVTLVQSNLQWQQADINRTNLSNLLAESVSSTDLILLPEMFTSAFSMDSGAIAEDWPGPTVDWMKDLARTYDAAVCGSVAISDQGKRYNRLIFVTPDGDIQYYDKKHLFRMLGEDTRYSAGDKRLVIEWRGWRIFPLVCYDLRFPVWSRNTPALDYDLLIYVANWPAPRSHHWQTLLKARAIENLSCVAGVNRIGKDGNKLDYSGHSLLVDAGGKVLLDAGEQAGIFTASIDKSDLQKYRDTFPFHLDADEFSISN